MIAMEVIHALKRRTRGSKGELALKIDISKAYHKVEDSCGVCLRDWDLPISGYTG
jgi:hypothetical protein